MHVCYKILCLLLLDGKKVSKAFGSLDFNMVLYMFCSIEKDYFSHFSKSGLVCTSDLEKFKIRTVLFYRSLKILAQPK